MSSSAPQTTPNTMGEESADIGSPHEVEAASVEHEPQSRENSPTMALEGNHRVAADGEEPVAMFTRVAGVHRGEEVDRCQSSSPTHLLKRYCGPPVTTSTTTNSIALNWGDNFPFNSLPNNTKFIIDIKMGSSFAWTLVYHGRATSHSVTGLPADTEVGVRLRATDSNWSWEALCRTLPGPPDAPLMAKALNIGSNEVELQWRPPVHDGGSPITVFRVEMEMRASAWRELVGSQTSFASVGCSTDSSFVAKELEPGSTYCFRVQACSKLGAGPYSRLVVVETLPAPPAIPEPPVVLEQTSKSLSLSWLSPPCNGASVDSFQLQMLVLGYGLRAAFDHGPGSELYDLQPAATLTNGEDQRVHKDRSTSSLSKYGTSSEGDYKDGTDGAESEVSIIYNGPSQEFEVKKLAPFSSYAFRVQAQNAVGSSGFSAYLVCMTSAASPCPPPPPTVIDANVSSLTLKWEAPERDNGCPVLRYTLEMQELPAGFSAERDMNVGKKLPGKSKKVGNHQDDAAVQPTTTRGWVVVYHGQELLSQVTGLAAGREYRFRVKAQNSVGTSSPSSALVAKSLPAAPGAPQPPTFSKVTSTSVQIKWSPPANDNGMPLTSYKLFFDDGQGGQLRKTVYEGEARSFSMSNLLPSSSYRAAVQAINAGGESDTSEVAVVETLPVAQAPRTPSPVDDLPCKDTPVPAVPAPIPPPETERPVPAVPALVQPPETEREVPAVPVLIPPPETERPVPAVPVRVQPPKTERRVPAVPAPIAKRRGLVVPAPIAKRRGLVVPAPETATVVVAPAKKAKRPTMRPTDNIKSKKEVKELVIKAHQPWIQKVANFIWRNVRKVAKFIWLNVRQIRPLWVVGILGIALLSFVFGFLLSYISVHYLKED